MSFTRHGKKACVAIVAVVLVSAFATPQLEQRVRELEEEIITLQSLHEQQRDEHNLLVQFVEGFYKENRDNLRQSRFEAARVSNLASAGLRHLSLGLNHVSTSCQTTTDQLCPAGAFPVTVNASALPYALCVQNSMGLLHSQISGGESPEECEDLARQAGAMGEPASHIRIVDIGAHIGRCAVLWALLGHPVLAIEPNPHSAELLRTNIAMNGVLDRTFIVEAALGDVDTTEAVDLNSEDSLLLRHSVSDRKMPIDFTDHALHKLVSTTEAVTIQVQSLDTMLARHEAFVSPRIVQIDCGGEEPRVLQGMLTALKTVSVVALTFWPTMWRFKGYDVNSPAELLLREGFNLFCYHACPWELGDGGSSKRIIIDNPTELWFVDPLEIPDLIQALEAPRALRRRMMLWAIRDGN